MKRIAAGIDMGGTNTTVGLVTEGGECLCEQSFRTHDSASFNDFISRVVTVVNNLRNGLDGSFSLVGAGIGAPNCSNAIFDDRLCYATAKSAIYRRNERQKLALSFCTCAYET